MQTIYTNQPPRQSSGSVSPQSRSISPQSARPMPVEGNMRTSFLSPNSPQNTHSYRFSKASSGLGQIDRPTRISDRSTSSKMGSERGSSSTSTMKTLQQNHQYINSYNMNTNSYNVNRNNVRNVQSPHNRVMPSSPPL